MTDKIQIDEDRASELLREVARAQHAFWDALRELENALGDIEIDDDSQDFDNTDIHTLLEKANDDDKN